MNKTELLKRFEKLKAASHAVADKNGNVNCNYCDDCYHCYDCDNCYDCLLCAGLINKHSGYWLLNKEVTKEEFEAALKIIKGENA